MMDPIQEREEGEEQEAGEGEDHLHNFRQQWKQELQQGAAGATDQNLEKEKDDAKQEEDLEDEVHKQARALFLQGVQYEESGKLFEAIRCYKRAERLVPNIELETFDYTGRNMKKKSPSVAKEEEAKVNVEDPKEVNEAELEGLCQKFSRMRSTEKSSLIQMEVKTDEVHLGDLPSEVINYILKWVVSKELDLRSLERVAAVCRGLYLAARDQDIWRLAYQGLGKEQYISKASVLATGLSHKAKGPLLRLLHEQNILHQGGRKKFSRPRKLQGLACRGVP